VYVMCGEIEAADQSAFWNGRAIPARALVRNCDGERLMLRRHDEGESKIRG
jgi:hypothetical protein